ncbi:MAG: N-acetylmuramoyl-L-alanine amidase [Verrucomicrobiales bacterium]|nr:N-acetylmuramoyl-L-alanine amidase [Verrucomicrobiales bacterium]
MILPRKDPFPECGHPGRSGMDWDQALDVFQTGRACNAAAARMAALRFRGGQARSLAHPLWSFPLGVWTVFLLIGLTSGCRTTTTPKPGTFAVRHGDEIVVAGQFVHTGTPVVLWMDPGGYDAYRVERRFSPLEESDWETSRARNRNLTSPNRYGLRQAVLTPEQAERVRGGTWDLPLLQSVVDQFVIHFDASGTSRNCFRTLHDLRDLSVHFMLDLDGTIYQTLDLKERAWHATTSNSRSIGLEIANVGAFELSETNPFHEWFEKEPDGQTRITVPARVGESGIRTRGFVGRPVRIEPVRGRIQNKELLQYDFTPEQYEALVKLTATLCKVFPKIKCDYPRDAAGQLIPFKLPDDELSRYQGLLGHYHIQTNKVDPGPAFQWDYVIAAARRMIARPR